MLGASFAAPNPTDLSEIAADGSPRRIARGSRLFHEGDPPDVVYFVHTGLVKIKKTAHNGVEVLLVFRGPGGLVGEHSAIDGQPRLTSAIAATDILASTLPRERLLAMVSDDPGLALRLLTSFSGQLRATMIRILESSSHDAPALVASRLLQLAEDPMFATMRHRDDDTTCVDMPLSQSEMADWAGVSRRSVAEAFRRLRVDGVISTSRLQVAFHDLAALERSSRV